MVLSFTFAALIRPWTQNGLLEGVDRKFFKNPTNFSSTHVRICVKDATPVRWSERAMKNGICDIYK